MPPSGLQILLSNGSASAVVTEVGGALRTFDVGGEPVLFGYPAEVLCTGGRGQVLAPWPNRLEDGSYAFGTESPVAPLDEPERSNAIHGLVRWLKWTVTERSERKVTVAVELQPQPGYPWRLSLEVTYELSSSLELLVTAQATNLSKTKAPLGIGFHPYIHAGDGGVDACDLRLEANRLMLADDRGLPGGWTPVERGAHDFRRGASLSGRRLDDCFSGLGMADGSKWSAEVTRANGSVVTVTAGAEFPYVMCYTGDTLAPVDQRRAIAIEPMSCPPNAFRSKEALAALASLFHEFPAL
ncbi:MAG: aldose 1-epimerase family protein [Acidimicrobiales bacterium]